MTPDGHRRRPYIAGNWKMYKTVAEAEQFIQALLPRVSDADGVDVALIKLTKSSLSRTIGAPDGLNLIALEELWQLVLILRDDAGERHC